MALRGLPMKGSRSGCSHRARVTGMNRFQLPSGERVESVPRWGGESLPYGSLCLSRFDQLVPCMMAGASAHDARTDKINAIRGWRSE